MNAPSSAATATSTSGLTLDDVYRLSRPRFLNLAELIEREKPAVATRMRLCSSYDQVFEKGHPRYTLDRYRKTFRCGLRFCPYCGQIRTWLQARAAFDHVRGEDHADDEIMFVTVTQSGDPDEELTVTIHRFNAALKKFQSSVSRRKGVDGRRPAGAGFIEITHSKNSWHVHCHYLFAGVPLTHHELKTLWREKSMGCGLDVTTLRDGHKTVDFDDSKDGHAKRVSKYIAKGSRVSAFSDDVELSLLAEVIHATHGQLRFFRRFGKPNSRTASKATEVEIQSDMPDLSTATLEEFEAWRAQQWRYQGEEAKPAPLTASSDGKDDYRLKLIWLMWTSVRRHPPGAEPVVFDPLPPAESKDFYVPRVVREFADSG